jgi:Do/DeqQ family serine protease
MPPQITERTSYADAISNVAPCVVSIYTRTELRGKSPAALKENPTLRRLLAEKGQDGLSPDAQEVDSLGSGVVVSSNGYILTDNHVVQGADKITVATASGDEFSAAIVGTDPATDLAVLKIQAQNLSTAILADSSHVRVGDVVLAIGNPFGVGQTVTSGIISATQRSNLGITEYEDFIQTDAAINPGNSGGALVDAHGRLIGINTVILSSGGGFEGIGLAIPVNLAREVMRQLITQGKVVRGYLGVSLHPLTTDLAKAFNVSRDKGALVITVQPQSPAARAGLRPGDIILELNGKASGSSRELRLQIAQTPPHSQAKLKVRRIGGEEKTLVATLEESPQHNPNLKPGN